jgi:hypothetical protein
VEIEPDSLSRLLLNDAQRGQLAGELGRLLSHGFGWLELVVEVGRLRWVRPALSINNPDGKSSSRTAPSELEAQLGPWREAFELALSEVLAAGWGSLVIGVEHGRVRRIDKAPRLRARTGKTGPLGPNI